MSLASYFVMFPQSKKFPMPIDQCLHTGQIILETIMMYCLYVYNMPGALLGIWKQETNEFSNKLRMKYRYPPFTLGDGKQR